MTLFLDIRPRARADIDEITEYIAQQSPQGAARFLECVEITFLALQQFPRMGRTYSEGRGRLRGLRGTPVHGLRTYLVLYLVKPRSIDIVRVIHSARDLDALLHSSQR